VYIPNGCGKTRGVDGDGVKRGIVTGPKDVRGEKEKKMLTGS